MMVASLLRCCRFVAAHRYAVYVLGLLMVTYLINQCDTFSLVATNPGMAADIGYGERSCVAVNLTALAAELREQGHNSTAHEYCTASRCEHNATDWCEWQILAQGLRYQLLAGPMDTMLFAISGIPLGMVSEMRATNRRVLLTVCVVGWSAMTLLSGFAQEYWHLAVARILFGIFSSGCVPLSTSLISDYFSKESRGMAMGVFYFGVFIGYSMTFVLIAAERALGWRAVYYLAGSPGVAIGLLVLATVRDPGRGASEIGSKDTKVHRNLKDNLTKLRQAARLFIDPSLLLLSLGGGLRNGGGLCLAYNLVIFCGEFHPNLKVDRWMSWIPLIFASTSSLGGGYLSDRMLARKGAWGRYTILVFCTVVSAPFSVGLLYASSGAAAFGCLMLQMLIGEVWLGVSTTIVLDQSPTDLRASAVAIYFCVIRVVGGNMNLIVPPLRNALGDLRPTLVIAIGGLYWAGAILFTLSLAVRVNKKRPTVEPSMCKKDDSLGGAEQVNDMNYDRGNSEIHDREDLVMKNHKMYE